MIGLAAGACSEGRIRLSSFCTSALLIVCSLQLSGSDVARKLIMMAQVVAKSPPEAFVAYNANDPTSFSEVTGESNVSQARRSSRHVLVPRQDIHMHAVKLAGQTTNVCAMVSRAYLLSV